MIIDNFRSLLKLKDYSTRLLGIDIGTVRMGLSLSDPTWQIATPFKTIKRKNSNLDVEIDLFLKLINEYKIVGMIIGLPVNMNGTEGVQARKARDFAKKICIKIDLQILLWDERLSTQAATKIMLNKNISQRKKSLILDSLAASYILQGVLNALQQEYLIDLNSNIY